MNPRTHRTASSWLLRPGDRKSTRLNSSHANISYAVFCLKKNKLILSPLHTTPASPLRVLRRGTHCPFPFHHLRVLLAFFAAPDRAVLFLLLLLARTFASL